SASSCNAASISDSPHTHEGLFYIWAEAEIDAALQDEAILFKQRYDVRTNGNAPAEGDPTSEFRGTNILHIAKDIETLASQFKLSPQKVLQRLEHYKKVLFDLRSTRPRPHRDEKIIPAWNGLMISALARAG